MEVSYSFYFLVLGFFIIAFLYSSVGFGGGSSYLALLSLVLTSFLFIRTSALVCNLVVVAGSTFLYFKNGHLHWKKFVPFVLTSVPFAFLGATFRLQENYFFILLGFSLIAASLALIFRTVGSDFEMKPPPNYPKYSTYLLGAGIGLLSGLVGIGGGIFLAPVLNHLRWDKPMVIAALASFFILVNSLSGLFGLYVAGNLELWWPQIGVLVLAVFLGGQLGVRMALVKFSPRVIRIITAILVLIVGVRVLIKNGFQWI